MINIVMYIILGALSLSGLILTLLDFPGIWLIYLSAVILGIVTGFETITPLLLVILFFISLLSTFIDNIVVALGAKTMGGSKWGMLGAILGGIIGLIVGNIIGLFLGPLIGATIFEYIFAHKDLNQSFKAGLGSFIGVFVSIILKTVVNISIIVFVISKLL
jgi:uncharacterized protein